MANVAKKRRSFQIKSKQKRSKKLRILKEKYQKAESKIDKDRILEKVKKLAPFVSPEKYLQIAKKNKKK